MSKGPGAIEKRIAGLFAGTRDQSLTVGEIADYAFALAGQPADRAQRLSATRAAHRLLLRMREAESKRSQLISDAHSEAKAAVGERPTRKYPVGLAAYKAAQKAYDVAVARYDAALKATECWRSAEKLNAYVDQFGSWVWSIYKGDGPARGEREYWRATSDRSGTLYFHPPDVPIRVWAVSIQRAGVVWAEAEVERITKRNVNVRYAGDTARLDRETLWEHWQLQRGVDFVSSRSSYDAQHFDELWQEEYGPAYERQQHEAEGEEPGPPTPVKGIGSRSAAPAMPMQLSHEEMQAVLAAAGAIAFDERDRFLRELADELERHPQSEIGPGLVHRLAREAQRLFTIQARSEVDHGAGVPTRNRRVPKAQPRQGAEV